MSGLLRVFNRHSFRRERAPTARCVSHLERLLAQAHRKLSAGTCGASFPHVCTCLENSHNASHTVIYHHVLRRVLFFQCVVPHSGGALCLATSLAIAPGFAEPAHTDTHTLGFTDTRKAHGSVHMCEIASMTFGSMPHARTRAHMLAAGRLFKVKHVVCCGADVCVCVWTFASRTKPACHELLCT